MGIASINPATGEVLKTFEPISAADLEAKLALAAETYKRYRTTSFDQRSQWLIRAAELLEQRKEELAKTMTLEMGKLLKIAVPEVEKCANLCRYYADYAEGFLADEPAKTDASRSFVRYLPLGPVLAVMPWNFPLWQVFRFAAPALMAGNVGLLKHASNVPQCAIAIEAIFRDAGFPVGAFQTLLIPASQVADVVADNRVVAATLTGSEAAGASLAAAAGKALKPTVLELGGSDPFIVTASADFEAAVSTAVTARMLNNGQTCIAAKRFILLESIAEAFTEKFVAQCAALKLGDPMAPDVDLGPLATPQILKDLDQQVQACIAAGAKLVLGGQPAELSGELAAGNFYPATILSDLPAGCAAYEEEFFGPVALLFTVKDLDGAIALANFTPFGLGASAWTQDPAEQERFINELEAGAVFINGMVKSDPRMPFGGIKRSGYGRELAEPGIRAFVNAKTVWVK